MQGRMMLINKIKLKMSKSINNKFVYLEKFIANNAIKKIKLLDVGCGNRSPSLITSMFPDIEYFGLDKEEYNLTKEDKKILENHFFNVDLDNILQLDSILPNNYFDFIMVVHVIEHTINGTQILEILAKKLRVGGGIYIEFPSVKSLSFPSMQGTLNFCDDPTHVRIYDIKEIANALLKSGFTIVKAETRRNLLGCVLTPGIMIYHLLEYKKIMGWAYWDILGFTEYIYAIKKKA